jgi:hypothetical protein
VVFGAKIIYKYNIMWYNELEFSNGKSFRRLKMKLKAEIMDNAAVKRALKRISHEILEKNGGCDNLCFVGIKNGGVPIAQLLADNIYEIEGVLMTMFNGRTNLSIQVVEEIKKYFGKKVYKTLIPRNVRLSEAPGFGEPINVFDKNSTGAIAYEKLSVEVLDNNR